jgi:DNA-binding SARP family transcriptional activator
MDVYSVTLFNRLEIKHGAYILPCPPSSKALEVLSYVLLFPHQLHHREALACLLWGDLSPKHSRSYLRKTLWQLHAYLDTCNPTGEPLFTVDEEWMRFNPESRACVDVHIFEAAYKAVQGREGGGLFPLQVAALQQAYTLYTADLLQGWYQDWCVFERERYQQMYLAMLDKLIEYCDVHGDYEAGVSYGTQILRIDFAREKTHRHLMRFYACLHDRTSALRQYVRCAEFLADELHVEPGKRTRKLYEQIRDDGLDERICAPIAHHSPQSIPDQCSLQEIQALLISALSLVQQELVVGAPYDC